MKSRVRILLLGVLAAAVLIQIVPYGRNHTNPSTRVEPAWNSADTRELAVRACYDCHSNETVWPWYSHVAPASWLVQRDVDRGRRELNFSEWNRPQDEADEAAEMVQKGKMPLSYYVPAHPEARLSQAEREALIAGLTATMGSEKPARGEGEHSGDDD
jgi:hypothetical protein